MLVSPEINIVKIGTGALTQLRSLACTTFYETFAADNAPEQMQRYMEERLSDERLLSELNRPESEFYLAYLNRQAIAYIKLNINNAQTEAQGPESLELERIYVLKQFWGTGLGQQLLDFAINRATALAKSKIWLGVWEFNQRALRFYQKNGFVVFGSHNFHLGDEIQQDLLMQRFL
jgi:ribosomal protein S18 acetylase RimI-like enzyme